MHVELRSAALTAMHVHAAQAEEYVPLPKGDVHKKKEIVQVCLCASLMRGSTS